MVTGMAKRRRVYQRVAVMMLQRRNSVCYFRFLSASFFIHLDLVFRGVSNESSANGGSHGQLCRYGRLTPTAYIFFALYVISTHCTLLYSFIGIS